MNNNQFHFYVLSVLFDIFVAYKWVGFIHPYSLTSKKIKFALSFMYRKYVKKIVNLEIHEKWQDNSINNNQFHFYVFYVLFGIFVAYKLF